MHNDLNYAALRQKFQSHNQEHVFQFWEKLTAAQQEKLLRSAAAVNFEWLEQRWQNAKNNRLEIEIPQRPEPAPIIRLPRSQAEKDQTIAMKTIGENALRRGEVGVFLVAGGQGSRLGFSGPKGCYRIGSRSLFQWHAEQIAARAARYQCVLPWYIMTSELNHRATVEFFHQHDYFGLDEKNVFLFPQRMVPSIDHAGKLLLAEIDEIALNPDGHGGALWAMVNSGAIADMKKRGINYLSYFQVDNPLVRIADPIFLGYHLNAAAQMSSKILAKAYPEEKVGHICLANGKTTVIEYCDLSKDDMRATTADGQLKFWAGSIAIHLLNVDFVEEIGGQAKLPWHIAQKKIPYIASNGEKITPQKNNGMKFETFIFDALPLARNSITIEVAREEEFAPVKNADGIDSAASCRQLMSNRFGRWIEQAGAQALPRDPAGNIAMTLEISPKFALDAEEFAAKKPQGIVVGDGLIIN